MKLLDLFDCSKHRTSLAATIKMQNCKVTGIRLYERKSGYIPNNFVNYQGTALKCRADDNPSFHRRGNGLKTVTP
jgi:hypothetical protein